jgi:pyruvate/2-oxoglutarate dehydrogenase complex dihydrolipoamide acyltransferase (E2) component
MTFQAKLLCAVAVSGFAALAATAPAQALTTQECSAKYQAAKTAGTLNGQKWNDFRKAQCGADATPAAAPAAAAPAAPAAPAEPKAAAKKEPAPAAAPAPTMPMGNAVFPNAVDAKYAKETAGKARLHTCVDQYNANKTTNGNGGMKWIEKGGGYYSECNKKLKGAA